MDRIEEEEERIQIREVGEERVAGCVGGRRESTKKLQAPTMERGASRKKNYSGGRRRGRPLYARERTGREAGMCRFGGRLGARARRHRDRHRPAWRPGTCPRKPAGEPA